MKYARAFEVRGEIEKIFQMTQSYASGIGFRTETAVRPDMVVLKRGSVLGSLTSFRVEKVMTILTILLAQKGKDVHILCEYDVAGFGGIFTSGDKSTLESETEKLKYHLEIASSNA